jgi:hypothetical protein
MRAKRDGEVLRYPMTLGSYMFRRLLHLMNVLIFIYYLIPVEIFWVPKKAVLVLVFGLLPFVIEWVRLRKGVILPGQRLHEDRSPGAYAWSLWTSMIIILVLPQQIALPVIMVYAVGDPIIGEIRLWRKDMVFPFGGAILFLLFLPFGYNVFLAAIAALFMVIGEAVEMVGEVRVRPELLAFYRDRIKIDISRIVFKTDDDGTTQIVPALALGAVYIYWPSLFPGPFFTPLA